MARSLSGGTHSIPWRHVRLEAQGRFLRVKVDRSSPGKTVGGGRGTVTDFSQASRKRMLEYLARIDFEGAGFVAFATLTYPDREGPPSAEETERDRQTILKRIGRLAPECSAIWRREQEARKSGRFEGIIFPHYHALFFGLPFLPHEDLNAMWREVLEHDDYVRTEIKGIKSWRQALSYVAKYMAKVERQWDPVESYLGTTDGAADCSLVHIAYLTAEDGPRSIGRSWGVFHRKHLPLAEKREVYIPEGRWLREVRRLAKQEWHGVPDCPWRGFSLFTEDAERLLETFEEVARLHEQGRFPPTVGPESRN